MIANTLQRIRPTGAPAPQASRGASTGPAKWDPDKPSLGFQIWTVIIMLGPICGTFYPPESYFGTWNAINQVEVLPYPITPTLLIIISLTALTSYLKMRRIQKVTHEPLAYFFFFVAFASCAWSFDPRLTFLRSLRILPLVTLGVIYAQLVSTKQILRLLIIAYLISAVASIFVSVAFPAYGQSGNLSGEYSTAWRGATSNKNSAGYIYGLGVMLNVFAATFGINWRLILPSMLGCLVVTVMSQSATGLISMAIALSVSGAFWLNWRLPKGVGPLFIVMMLLLSLTVVAIVLAEPSLVQALTGRDATLTGRTDIWEPVITQIARSPIIGYGYAFWGVDSPARQAIWDYVKYEPPHSHNSWLDLMLQLGIVGALPIAFIAVRALIVSVAKAAMSPSLPNLTALGILVFVLSRSFTEVQFTEPGSGGTFWLIWASIVARRA